ncbi:MAG: kinase/pyrophosphorylase [Anaerolineales bacterium]|jgi:regulator of PEP synthase PpsR (kinase-PPPase family)|nr:kinase/pyrophosphorylase [Anaerolineales bacterium]
MTKIFAVSDGTGTTADTVARAALAQFDAQIEVEIRANVRTAEKIHEVVLEAVQTQGLIIHTLVLEDLRREMFNAGRTHNVATIDLLGPLLVRLSETLSTMPRSRPGVFKSFETGYLFRIDALDFTVRHDDGLMRHDLDEADLILIGLSRTAKTPLSIYLAYRGWKVANLPLTPGLPIPSELFEFPKHKVVGLTISPERLFELRVKGSDHPGISPIFYRDPAYIRKEVSYAKEIFDRGKWPLIDMSHKSVEEAASEIMSLVGVEDR